MLLRIDFGQGLQHAELLIVNVRIISGTCGNVRCIDPEPDGTHVKACSIIVLHRKRFQHMTPGRNRIDEGHLFPIFSPARE